MTWPTRTAMSAVLCLAASVLTAGCAGLRPYSEVRDKQAQAAQTAWQAVDLKALIATERRNLNSLLAAELAAQDQLATSIRDHRLRHLLSAVPMQEALVAPIDADLRRLVGDPATFAQSRQALQRQRVVAEQALDALRIEFSAKRLPMPSCLEMASAAGAEPEALRPWLTSAPAVDAAEIRGALVQLRQVCQRLGSGNEGTDATLLVQVLKPLGGLVAQALQRYQADAQALTSRQQATLALQSQYQQALQAHEAAVRAGQADPKVLPAVAQAAEGLQQAVDALAASKHAQAAQFLSRERLAAADRFLQAVTDGANADNDDGPVPEGASRAAAAFVLLPGLADDAREAVASTRRPLAVPLLMRRNIEALNLEAAQRDVATQQAELRLQRELLDTLYQHALQLWIAQRELNQDGRDGTPDMRALHAQPLADALGSAKTTPAEKEALYSATARYLDGLKRLEARRYKLEYRRVAQAHERRLAQAEVNTQQWSALIGSTVNQVAHTSAGGIKAGHVAALLNTAGLLWIGHGVN